MEIFINDVKEMAEHVYKVALPKKVKQIEDLRLQLTQKGTLQPNFNTTLTDCLSKIKITAPPTKWNTQQEDGNVKENGDVNEDVTMLKGDEHEEETRPMAQDLENLGKLVQPIYTDGMRHAILLSAWVSFLAPAQMQREQLGDFVRHEIKGKLDHFLNCAKTYLDNLGLYHEKRAKLVAKVQKHSNIQDFRLALRSTDESMNVYIDLSLRDMSQMYAELYDIFCKNLPCLLNEGHCTASGAAMAPSEGSLTGTGPTGVDIEGNTVVRSPTMAASGSSSTGSGPSAATSEISSIGSSPA